MELALQEYSLEIQHIPRSENVVADAYLDVSVKDMLKFLSKKK